MPTLSSVSAHTMRYSGSVFRAYIDESAEGPIFAVGGFVGRDGRWDSIEPRWPAFLPEGIDYFHTTDCFGGRGQFKALDIPERVALLDLLTNLIIESKLLLVGGAIDAPAYRRIAPKKLANHFLGNKYAAAGEIAVSLACMSTGMPAGISGVADTEDNKCALFIEQSLYSPSMTRGLESVRNDEILWWRNRVGTVKYGSKSGPNAIPLLQIGDFGAFLVAKRIANAPQGKIPWNTYYDKLLNARCIFKMQLADTRSLDILRGLQEEDRRQREEGKSYWDEV